MSIALSVKALLRHVGDMPYHFTSLSLDSLFSPPGVAFTALHAQSHSHQNPPLPLPPPVGRPHPGVHPGPAAGLRPPLTHSDAFERPWLELLSPLETVGVL